MYTQMLKNMQTNFDYKYLPNFLKYILIWQKEHNYYHLKVLQRLTLVEFVKN